MKLEVLHVPDCPNLPPMLQRLGEVTDRPVTTRVIESDAEAAEFGMAGSPTLLIDGVDPFAATDGCDCGVSCRLYRDPDGRIVSAPSVEQLRDALAAAGQAAAGAAGAAGEVLSAWRTRALPLDPVERSVQQAILRTFAATGHPTTPGDLDAVTAGSGRGSAEVLTALHDVYAMCAIDALGMSAMLAQDSRIESVDVTTGQPITVTTSHSHTSWKPADQRSSPRPGPDPRPGRSRSAWCPAVRAPTRHQLIAAARAGTVHRISTNPGGRTPWSSDTTRWSSVAVCPGSRWRCGPGGTAGLPSSRRRSSAAPV
jgi:hypothetical protein